MGDPGGSLDPVDPWIRIQPFQICGSLDPGSVNPWIRTQPFQICASVDPDPAGSSLDPWIRGSVDPGSPIPAPWYNFLHLILALPQ